MPEDTAGPETPEAPCVRLFARLLSCALFLLGPPAQGERGRSDRRELPTPRHDTRDETRHRDRTICQSRLPPYAWVLGYTMLGTRTAAFG